jgi:hypothetical protein
MASLEEKEAKRKVLEVSHLKVNFFSQASLQDASDNIRFFPCHGQK